MLSRFLGQHPEPVSQSLVSENGERLDVHIVEQASRRKTTRIIIAILQSLHIDHEGATTRVVAKWPSIQTWT
jgi:hypothetical protein